MPQYEDSQDRVESLFETAALLIALGYTRMIRRLLKSEAPQEIIEAEVRNFARTYGAATSDAGVRTASWYRRVTGNPFTFDVTMPNFLNDVTQRQFAIEQFILNEQRTLLARAFVDGAALNHYLGLSSRQVLAVQRYQRLLRDLDGAALRPGLRPEEADEEVRVAVRGDEPIPESRVNALVALYAANLRKHRATTLAHAEAQRAVHSGLEEVWAQLLALDQIEDVQHVWRTIRDNLRRDHHASMEGQIRPEGDPFVSGLGNFLRYPGDSTAPQKDTAGCRCSRVTTFVTIEA